MMKPFQLLKTSILSTLLMSVSYGFSANDEIFVVGIQPLTDLLISSKNSAPASIISLNKSVISAEITGQIEKINVEAGDYVKKNQKLVSLDCRSYSLARKQALASLKVAEAQLNYSQKQFKRNNRLVNQGTIPREIFEKSEASQITAVADIELKKASIDTANLAISRCQIKAPFAGQITKRHAQKGQLVSAGTPLFELMQNNRFEIKAFLSPDKVIKINDLSELKFVSGNIVLKTALRSVIRTIDEATRTQEVRLSLSRDTLVPAGLSGRLEWNSKEQQLPAEYIIRRNGQLGVLIAEDIVESNTQNIGKAKFYSLPNAREGQAEVVNLPESSFVITKNRYRIEDGQTIKIQK